MLGTFHDTLAQKLYPNATIIQYESSNDLPLAITTGKIDAAFSDRDRLVERLRDNPQLAIIGEPLVRMPVAVGLRKGNTELRDAFNRFLAEIKSNGIHADMVDRWMEKRDTEMPDIADGGSSSGELVVGSQQRRPAVRRDHGQQADRLRHRARASDSRPISAGRSGSRRCDVQRPDRRGGDRQGGHDRQRASSSPTSASSSINFSDPYYEEGDAGLRPEEEHRGLRQPSTRRRGARRFFASRSRRASTATSSRRSATSCCGTGSRPPC